MTPASGSYDAVVIGAGIAGLFAATALADRGRRVLVLEHGHQPGGLMAGIERRGFRFDVGCQSFEDMGIVFPLLEAHGLSDLARFRRARYRLVMPGLDADVESIPQIGAAFARAFPECAEGLGRVFAVHQRTSELIGRLFRPDRVPFVRDGGPESVVRWAAHAVGGAGWSSPARALARLRELGTLLLEDSGAWYRRELPPSGVRELLASCGYSKMNVFVASAFWHLWAHDYWYPEGGLQPFFDRWAARLRARGVTLLLKRTAVGLETARGRVAAVITHRGERFEADQVIYTGDLRQLRRLLPAPLRGAGAGLRGSEAGLRPAEAARVERAPHSDALVSVYVGLDVPPGELRQRLRTDHVFHFPDLACTTALDPGDPAAHARAFLEITAHGIHDPSLAPPGRSAVVLQAFTRHDWLDGWGTGLAGDTATEPWRAPPRAEAYRRRKREVADQLLRTFERLVPGAAARAVHLDVGAPPSTVRFTRNAFGGSCGFALDWRSFPFRVPLGGARSPVENLHLAGHFTVWPGAVPTAALSGKLAALRADDGLRRRRGSGRGRGTAAPSPVVKLPADPDPGRSVA